jgi:ribosome biogenesis GTPase
VYFYTQLGSFLSFVRYYLQLKGIKISSNEDFFEFENEHFSDRISKKSKAKTKRKDISSSAQLDRITGKVVESKGKYWNVLTPNGLYLCETAGTIVFPEIDGSLVVVGDSVEIIPDENTPFTGKIVVVQERVSKLSRTAAGKNQHKEQVIVANVDQLVIMVAADDPPYRTRFIDRMLISASKGGLEPILFINKSELLPLEFLQEDLQEYFKLLKDNVHIFSLEQQINCESIQDFFAEKTSVVAGPSGVGKTTLVNYLVKNSVLKTGITSKKWRKGKHTTSSVTLLSLPNNGFIVDTPGIRELSIWSLDTEELMYYFDEFEEVRHLCKFATCTHRHEPECAVIEAVEKGQISDRRYLSYVILFEEIEQKS